MPLPKPKTGESQSDFIGRCMSEAYGADAPKDRTQEQAVAMCHQAWRDVHGGSPPKKYRSVDQVAAIIVRWKGILKRDPSMAFISRLSVEDVDVDDPEQGESYSDFMDRCTGSLTGIEDEDPISDEEAEDACQSAWEASGENEDTDDKAARDAVLKNKRLRRKAQVASVIATWKSKFGADPSAAIVKAIGDAPFPEPDEDEDDFMQRCYDEITQDGESDEVSDEDAEGICEEMWDKAERRGGDDDDKAAGDIVHKTHTAVVQGAEFVLSDETPDRMDDIILASAWQIESFAKNPIALFNHDRDFIVGTWKNIGVNKDKQLRGHLQLAPKGTSPRIDEIRNLIDADILRGVSVGFRAIDARPRPESKSGGLLFTKCDLVEVSLVSIPANPNALAVAKALNVSDETQKLIFGRAARSRSRAVVPASRTRAETGSDRAKAQPPASLPKPDKPAARGGQSMLLGKRIEDAEKLVVSLQDKLTAHLDSLDDQNPDETSMQITEELTTKIAAAERSRDTLKAAETRLAKTSDNNGGGGRGNGGVPAIVDRRASGLGPRPYGLTAKKIDPLTYLMRQGVVQLVAHKDRKPLDVVRAELYGDDEPTRVFLEYTMRAASAPAMTSVTGWAAELVQQIYTDFMEALVPSSVMPRLSTMGLALTFGRAGKVVIPTRSLTPSLAGSFVGEGQPIPVRQGAFTAQALTPKKMAVITTWTREMDEHSTPAIEGLLREAVQIDTATALDYVLLDANPATTIRPAGLRNGVAGLTPTTGGGFTALVGDIKQLTGALLTATQGHIRKMVFLMNPQQVLSISLIQPPNAATGLFPFSDEIQAGKLRGATVIESGNVPLGTVIALDAADFVSVGSEAPRFEVSDQATLHMEDTAPADITGGTPSPATPVKSMWQTDSMALRLIWPMNWTLRRPNMVSWIAGVTW